MTRQLTEVERTQLQPILARLRKDVAELAGRDAGFIFAAKRYVRKRLEFDERGTPAERRKVKFKKMVEQKAMCAECGCSLKERDSELDRIDPMAGYTVGNTRLLCHDCHRKQQEARGFS